MTNRSRGFGFVEMSDGAEAAIEALNGTEVDGRELVVNESRPKEKLTQTFQSFYHFFLYFLYSLKRSDHNFEV